MNTCNYLETNDILLPYEHIIKNVGKGMRDLLIDAFNIWLSVDVIYLNKVKEIIRILHNASLLVDDIEDNSDLRRGIPTSHILYGVPLTINAANYMYFDALKKVLSLDSIEAVKVFTDSLIELHHGQGKDIYWRDNHLFTGENCCQTCEEKVPTLGDYKSMVIDKTGGLFRLALKILNILSNNKKDIKCLTDLSDKIGLYYQIRDDYINLTSEDYSKEKSFCEDLTEGKFSFIVIYASEYNQNIIKLLRNRTTDLSEKVNIVNIIKETGAFEYTKNCIRELEKEINTDIESLGGNTHLTKFMEKLKII